MSLITLDNTTDKDAFINLITKNNELPDLIICYFTASWCGPCKMISPTVTNIANNNTHLKVIKIDIDECEEISEFCEISCMPTFKFYKNNNIEPIHTFSGADNNELINTIELLLNNTNQDNTNQDNTNQDNTNQYNTNQYNTNNYELNEITDF